MRAYWDSTALFNALCSATVAQRLRSGEHVTRSHAYVETFHHISGERGLRLVDGTRISLSPLDCARMIRELSGKLKVRDLDTEQTLAALDDAQSRGVSGRMVHDWLHVRAAKLAGADTVLSRDQALSELAVKEGLKAEHP